MISQINEIIYSYVYFDVIHSNLYSIYYQAWRFLAYVLVHAGWVHICSNIIGKTNLISFYKIIENPHVKLQYVYENI